MTQRKRKTQSLFPVYYVIAAIQSRSNQPTLAALAPSNYLIKFLNGISEGFNVLLQYLKKECGQRLNVDGQKAEIEYKTLVKFDEIQPHSVPNVYVLDRPRKASQFYH